MILNIRESVQSDFEAIESLYPEAFPDEDLLPVAVAAAGTVVAC